MYQIDNSTAAVSQPAATAAGSAGFFTDGNPATSTPATIVPAEWLNAVMMELANVVTGAGLTLSKSTYTQVRDAIKRLIQNQVVLTDTGSANAYAATNSPALVSGTWTNGVTQQVKITNANTSASTYAPDGLTAIPIYGLGLQPLQGGELYAGGTAILMKQTITGINSGNPICVLMECSGGTQQVAPATAGNHAAQFAQLPAVVGTVRNAIMSLGAAAALATFTANEVIVESALGGLAYRIGSFNKTINLGTTGANGMDTGTAPVSGFVALYAIYNPTTGASALLGVNATSAVAPEVYGGANMPAGYTASALVSVWGTNASGQFVVGYQTGRTVHLPTTQVLNGGSATTYTSISLSGVVPKNAKAAYPNMTCQPGSSSNGYFLVADPTTQIGLRAVASPTTGGQLGVSCAPITILTAQTLYYQNNVAGSQASLSIAGYEF